MRQEACFCTTISSSVVWMHLAGVKAIHILYSADLCCKWSLKDLWIIVATIFLQCQAPRWAEPTGKNCGGLTLAECQVPKAPLPLPSSTEQRRKYNEKLLGWDKGRETSLTKYCHGKNRLNLGKLVYYQSNKSRIMRNKTKP